MRRTTPFFLFTIAVFAALLLPVLVQQGMFLDGVTYSAISHNLANGLGQNWNPHYTDTLYPEFHEHPALFFIIESGWFRIFGHSIWIERVFSLSMAVIHCWGIVLCWRLFMTDKRFRSYFFLPILLWIATPIVFWSFQNNMLENLLSCFTLFAVYFISRGLLSSKYIFSALGSIFILFGVLTKGPVGLFPLALPILFIVAFGQFKDKKLWLHAILFIAFTCILFIAVFTLYPEVAQNIEAYLQQQLLPALSNKREVTTHHRWSILGQLLLELTLPVIVCLVIIIFRRVRKTVALPLFRKEIFFFLLVGISASLPLMVTLKQRPFYLVPAIVYFSFVFALYLLPFLQEFVERISLISIRRWRNFSLVLLLAVGSFSAYNFGRYSRDREMLEDIDIIRKSVPANSVIGSSSSLWESWGLVAYLNRLGGYSLDQSTQPTYFLSEKNNPPDSNFLSIYRKLPIEMKGYVLWEKSL